MKTKLLFFVLAAILATGCGQSNWKEFNSSEGAFRASMPDVPAKQTQRVNTQAGPMDMHMFIVEQEKAVYLIGYGDYPQVLVHKSGPQALLDGIINDVVASKPGSRLLNKQVTTLDGNPGRDFKIEMAGGEFTMHMRARLFLVDSRVYRLIVITPPEGSSSTDVTKFLDSFELVQS